MSTGLPLPEDDTLPAEIRETLENLPPLNVFRMVANAPASFKGFLELATSILVKSDFDPRKREIAVLRVAHVTKSSYVWTQHVRVAKSVGMTDEEIATISEQDPVKSLDKEG
ncbi:MAG: carboxymuconolactone decarboxylase family protein, partial [Deltaproteobacteria bacterium]|nr:carboxymuconolactone decarboxylase family protein [Deltaproteobacteria bacterium]